MEQDMEQIEIATLPSTGTLWPAHFCDCIQLIGEGWMLYITFLT